MNVSEGKQGRIEEDESSDFFFSAFLTPHPLPKEAKIDLMTKVSIHQEDPTTNVHAPNTVSKHIRQKLTELGAQMGKRRNQQPPPPQNRQGISFKF